VKVKRKKKPAWKMDKQKILDALKKHPLSNLCRFKAHDNYKTYDFRSFLGFNHETHEILVELEEYEESIETKRGYLDMAYKVLLDAGYRPAERDHVFYFYESRLI
jgi:hypothetical protein